MFGLSRKDHKYLESLDTSIYEDGSTLMYIEWSYRFKHFHPPMWQIFKWAFTYKKMLFTGCYPMSISSGSDKEESNVKISE